MIAEMSRRCIRRLLCPVLPVVSLLTAVACASGGRATTAPDASGTAAAVEGAAAEGGPTRPEIAEADLQRRLQIVAHDSMLGREAGTLGNVKATDYVAAEARRLGLQPAGENGTYFQTVPLVTRALAAGSSITVDGRPLDLETQVVAFPPGTASPFGGRLAGESIPVIYGGRVGDAGATLTADQVRGRIVVLSPHLVDGTPVYQFWTQPGLERFGGAAAIAVATLDVSPPNVVAFLREPQVLLGGESPERPGIPVLLIVSSDAATTLLGAAPATLQPGAAGGTVRADLRFADVPAEHPARNVVAVLPGADPASRGTYVAIGAHNDHDGFEVPVEHDSMRAFNRVLRPEGVQSPVVEPRPEQHARAMAILDSLRAARPARVDSIANGADDDGSGTVAVLEIAEALARGPEKPDRSVLFVWHTAEEQGLLGAQWFTDHSTVPRDSIVAQINIDMIGRGGAADVMGGGPGYIQLIGSRRLSTELGDLVETVNTQGGHGMRFDYQYDADGHPQNYYCRSDHYMYARYGIPVVFFTTGGHFDYHLVTDEPQYIDYAQLERVTRFIYDVTLHVADLDHRPVVDKPTPDPNAPCQQ